MTADGNVDSLSSPWRLDDALETFWRKVPKPEMPAHL